MKDYYRVYYKYLSDEIDKKIEVWDSGISIVKEVKVVVPIEILQVCKSIQSKIGNYEFSVLVKGKWSKNGFEIDSEYVIPKQKVGRANVDYSEALDKYIQNGYNVVIHSHPWGGSSFSSADDETINSNFEASLLFNGNTFSKAVVNIRLSDSLKLQLDAKIEVSYIDIEVDISNITKEEISSTYVGKWSDYYDLY